MNDSEAEHMGESKLVRRGRPALFRTWGRARAYHPVSPPTRRLAVSRSRSTSLKETKVVYTARKSGKTIKVRSDGLLHGQPERFHRSNAAIRAALSFRDHPNARVLGIVCCSDTNVWSARVSDGKRNVEIITFELAPGEE